MQSEHANVLNLSSGGGHSVRPADPDPATATGSTSSGSTKDLSQKAGPVQQVRQLLSALNKLPLLLHRLAAGVMFVETLPKNQTGKLLRRELKAQVFKGSFGY